jgi:hypothetical protein
MKKLGFLLIILSLAIIFSACPPLLEDYEGGASGDVVSYDDKLDCYKWFEILDKIAKDGKFVTLDLSKCTFLDGNLSGGLIKEKDQSDPLYPTLPVIFDPFSASASGKDFIISIILPEAAQIIKDAITINPDDKLDEKTFIENGKKHSAFRSFNNLRSVKADNVTYIGNFAFAGCKALTELNFPRVSHTVDKPDEYKKEDKNIMSDISVYAFLGCEGLKEIKFNTVAVIGEYAFKDCTNLTKMDFPEVWKIKNNAFDGCKSLVNVFFEKATKIGDNAFLNCTGLKKAEFNVIPERVDVNIPPNLISNPAADPNDLDPTNPAHQFDYDSVIFYTSVFNGCKALEVLNIRNAWNVYFSKDVFANTGATIDIYLFDEPDLVAGNTSFGHPQKTEFLGKDVNVTLKKIYIFTPLNNGKIQDNYSMPGLGPSPDFDPVSYSSIAKYIRATYDIDVNINKR